MLLPGDKSLDGGVVNHGYVGDITHSKQEATTNSRSLRPPSSADSTSGNFSTGIPI